MTGQPVAAAVVVAEGRVLLIRRAVLFDSVQAYLDQHLPQLGA